MKKLSTNSKSGFTIIEVVLVLAVAGLIFLMVFIALPAMQRSQRDTRRTSDMGRVQSALLNWQANHTNKLPSAGVCVTDDEDGSMEANNDACRFIQDYMNSAATADNTFQDPNGPYYDLVITQSFHGGGFSNNGTNYLSNSTARLTAREGRITLENNDGQAFDAYTIFIIPGAICDGDEAIGSTKNDFAIMLRMEGQGVKCSGSGH